MCEKKWAQPISLGVLTPEIWKMTKQEQLEVLMHENNDDLVGIIETWWDKKT